MASGKPQKLVLSDSDGVIVDSFALLYRNISKLFQDKAGKVLGEEEYRALFDGNALANVQKAIGASADKNFSEQDKALVFDGYAGLPVFPGIGQAYARIAKHHIVVVITSTAVEHASQVIDRHGLTDDIAAIIGPDTAVAKDERMKLAMEEFGMKPDQTWYVTDTTGDIKEAKAAGVHTVAVTWGYHDEDRLKAAQPDAVVHTPQELADYFS